MGCKIIRVQSKSGPARPVHSARGLRQRGRDGGTEEEPERVTLPRAGADGSPWRASTGSCQAHAECGSRNAVSKRRLLQAAERANHALRAMQVQGRRLLLQGLPGLPIHTAARVRCMHIPLAPRSESLRLCVQKKAWKLGHKLSCVPTSLASQEGHAQQIAKYVTRGLEQAGRPNQTASGRRRYAPIAESDFVTKFAELDAAEDWRGMLELADEAGAWISKVRRTRPSAAASIAQKMGLVHQDLRSFEGAIAFHLQFKAIAEEAGQRMKREVGWACGNLGIC